MRAVEEYNKYRAPEAEAQLIRVEGEEFAVRLRGPFCHTCGFYDYIDDLLMELRGAGVDAEVVEVVEEAPEGATVVFRARRAPPQSSSS